MRKFLQNFGNSIVNFTHSGVTPFLVYGSFNKFTTKDIPSLPPQFENSFLLKQYHQKQKKEHGNKQIYILLSLFWKEFLIVQLLHILGVVIDLIRPFIQKIILLNVLPGDDTSDWIKSSRTVGILFSGLLGLSEIIYVILQKYEWVWLYVFVTKVESVLLGTFYEKLLKLNSLELKKRENESFITQITLEFFHIKILVYSVAGIIELPILLICTTIFLFFDLGWPALFVLLICAILLPIFITISIISHHGFLQYHILKARESSFLSEVLKSIAQIKGSVLQRVFYKKLLKLKKKVFVKSFFYFVGRIYQSYYVLITNCFADAIIFTLCYFVNKSVFRMDVVFPAFSLIRRICYSIGKFPEFSTYLIRSYSCFQKYQNVFNGEEFQDFPTKRNCKNEKTKIIIKQGKFSWTKTRNIEKTVPMRTLRRRMKGKKVSKVDEDYKIYLSNVNLNIESGELIGICGATASGKSSLLLALLREMKLDDGVLEIYGEMSYCSQTPFFFHGTIKENIIFGREYDEKRFNEVIHSCGLDIDLQSFPNGIHSEIGEFGSTVSGGLKARINLGRTIYRNADIYMIDDIFRCIDPKVTNLAFRNSMLNFLKGKTRIVVTNQTKFLTKCDRVIIFDNMKVQDVGEYDELIKRNEYLKLISGNDIKKNKRRNFDYLSKEKGLYKKNKVYRECRLMDKEEVVDGYISLKVLWYYFKQFGTEKSNFLTVIILIIIFVLILFILLLKKFSEIWMTWWIVDKFNLSKEYYFFVYLISVLSIPFFIVVYLFILALLGLRASFKIYKEIILNVIYTKLLFFQSNPLGRILNRMSFDQHFVNSVILVVFVVIDIIVDLVYILFTIVSSSFYSIIPLVIVLIFYFVITEMYRKVQRGNGRIERNLQNDVVSFFEESLLGISTIRHFEALKYFQKKVSLKINKFLKTRYMSYQMELWKDVRMGFLCFSFMLVTLCMYTGFRELPGFKELTGIAITNFISMNLQLITFLDSLCVTEYELVSVERLYWYAKNLPIERDHRSRESFGVNEMSQRPSIEFKDVKMRYRPELPLVVNSISFKINPGEKVAVIGRSGAGKSSIFQILMKFVECEEGRVLINNIDISLADNNSVRNTISLLLQDAVIFTGTIRFNVDPCDVHSDEEIWDVLEKCALASTINKYPKQLEEKISPNSSSVSLGEKHLIALARILLENRKILCLDEITSTLDCQISSQIHRIIDKEFSKDTTVLLITHKIDTILEMDKILILDNGRIVEFDNPQVLSARKESIFNKMLKEVFV